MDTKPVEVPEGYFYNEALGIIEELGELDGDGAIAASPDANTITLYTERTYGIVGHAIVPDALGNKFMGVLKAQWDPPNANHRYVDVYKALPGSDTYTLIPNSRVEPPLKGDIVDMMIVGPDLWVGVTDHAPQEAPRDSNVDGKWLYGICAVAPPSAPLVHTHPEYVIPPEPRGGVCDPQQRPYFRRQNKLTRGQLCKIQVVCMEKQGFVFDPIPDGQQTFADVPPTDPFYIYIEKLASIEAIAGYPCEP